MYVAGRVVVRRVVVRRVRVAVHRVVRGAIVLLRILLRRPSCVGHRDVVGCLRSFGALSCGVRGLGRCGDVSAAPFQGSRRRTNIESRPESVQRVLRLDAVRGALVDLPAQSSQRGHRGALTGRQAAGPQLAAGPGATLL
jgi:hypothetical protein